jgi:FixJ family two-component response regulator
MEGPTRKPAEPEAAQGKVFLVDDEPSVRRALTRLFRSAGLDVESFPSAGDFLAAPRSGKGAVCLVADLSMPGLSGLDLQEAIQKRGLDLPIVFISGRADLASGVLAMKGGALDFLEKPVSDRDLLDAVQRALGQDRQRHAERSDRAVLEIRAARLTPREREVFGLVASGLLNKQVGDELGAAEKTIKVHRARVMEKMEAASLAELVRMADRLGLRLGKKA